MKIFTNYDFNGNQLLNVSLQQLATPPASPFTGQMYYNTTSNRVFTWNGTQWIGADAQGATMTGADIVTAINASSSLIDNDNLSSGVNTAISKAHDQAHKASHITGGDDIIDNFTSTTSGLVPLSGGGTTKYLRADGTWVVPPDTNTVYTHPNHTGDVTSVGDGATTIANKAVTLAKMADMATASFIGRNTAAVGVPEILSVATVKTMLGLVLTQTSNASGFALAGGTTSKTLTVSNTLTLSGTDSSTLNIGTGGTLNTGAFAVAYVHPTTSGNKHIPTGGATGNILGWASDGTASWITPVVAWADITNKPSSAVADIDDAVSKRHTQNTDTGTSSATFMIGTGGAKLKNVAGEIQIRNNADNAYADLRVSNLFVEGTTTTVNSETIELADNQLLLNSNITTNAGNANGGIAVKRLMADNTTRKDAVLEYDTSTEKWKATFGAVAGTLVSTQIANKVTSAIGNGALTSIPVTHNLNTRECVVSIRETASPYAGVMCDWEFTDLNTITFKFAVAPTTSQFTVTIVG